ncbi:LysR family transcriptional regulator [Microbacterium trichothecenolyticum]|uniref:DNA-binding transcriptional LysR family regulator n=1 Tax=Microbacterium trichothecenolyticum TaxID=69370 RepID=A0ABU0TXI0_MICTR|nr:LysR family transcriptional regulator [Microbacterium trichothecenolyticum]MDQ1124351.1 DNA-binding transcriptional LysR family regulator [Microbacterium trichothecenolyticum]
MDAAHLRLLRELADRGSVAAVAQALRVSPSAVSQQIASLQARVPVPLTTRRGRVLVLTPAGEALAAAGTRVDEALTAAREAVGAFLDDTDRPVRVSAFHSAGLALFGPLLRELDGIPPLHLADADVAHRDFPGLTADHDLVVAHRLAHDAPWPRGRVVATELLTEPLDIALPAAHPLAARERLVARDLAEERWVSVHPGFPLAGVLDHLAAHVGRPLEIAHRINEFSVTAEVVRAGAAIAVMPRTTAIPLAVDGLVLRPLSDLTLVRHVDALARPDALAYAAVRRVLRALQIVAARATDAAG